MTIQTSIGGGYVVEDVGGTSCAAPIAASILALLNEESIAVSGKQLGFLNPFLYQAAAAQPNVFNDITIGSNACSELTCCPYGFKATTGWVGHHLI